MRTQGSRQLFGLREDNGRDDPALRRSYGDGPRVFAVCHARHPHYWKGEHVLEFVRQALPGRTGRPRIVVLDNAGIHRSWKVCQTRCALAERGLWLWYLPAYRPELNDIERTFRTPGTRPCPNAPPRPPRP